MAPRLRNSMIISPSSSSEVLVLAAWGIEVPAAGLYQPDLRADEQDLATDVVKCLLYPGRMPQNSNFSSTFLRLLPSSTARTFRAKSFRE